VRRHQSGYAGQHDRLVLLRRGGAHHTRHEAEVGGETVVEAVHHVAQEAARFRAMPRLAPAAGHLAERARVLRGLAGEEERLVLSGAALGELAVHAKVAAHLAPLFGQQGGEEEAWSDRATQKGE
jgi:hypothetical protein